MIYNPLHPGKVFTTTAESDTLNLNSVFQGFLSKADINLLLAQSNCVGLRVYNAVASSADLSRRVMAVGIRENGTEKDGRGGVGYILSGNLISNGPPESISILNRDTATNHVVLAETTFGSSAEFSTFFSKAMLQNLMANKDNIEVAGVGFFANQFGEFRSFTGASFVLLPSPGRLENNPPLSHIQSDLPCPGFCAVAAEGDPVTDSDDPTGTAAFMETSGIYLVRWRKPAAA